MPTTSKADLLRALEFIAEGNRARLPKRLDHSSFHDRRFQTQVDKEHRKARQWLRGRGIQGLGIGRKICAGHAESDQCLRVYVRQKLNRKRIRASRIKKVPNTLSLPELGKIHTDVIEIGTMQAEAFTTPLRPPRPGISLSHISNNAGTFGCLVRKKNQPTPLYILSNSHVLADYGRANPGTPITQPGRDDGGFNPSHRIAVLDSAIPFEYSATYYLNTVDAAIAELQTTANSDIRILERTPTRISRRVRTGMQVKKVGKTSDLTIGIVTDTNYRFFLPYPKPGGGMGTVGFKNQVLCSRYTSSGDSGSVVLDNRNRIVGLHFAGSASASVFNPIGPVFDQLGIELA